MKKHSLLIGLVFAGVALAFNQSCSPTYFESSKEETAYIRQFDYHAMIELATIHFLQHHVTDLFYLPDTEVQDIIIKPHVNNEVKIFSEIDSISYTYFEHLPFQITASKIDKYTIHAEPVLKDRTYIRLNYSSPYQVSAADPLYLSLIASHKKNAKEYRYLFDYDVDGKIVLTKAHWVVSFH